MKNLIGCNKEARYKYLNGIVPTNYNKIKAFVKKVELSQICYLEKKFPNKGVSTPKSSPLRTQETSM